MSRARDARHDSCFTQLSSGRRASRTHRGAACPCADGFDAYFVGIVLDDPKPIRPMTSSTPRNWANHPVIATIVGIFAAGLVVLLTERAGHALLGAADPAVPNAVSTAQYASVLLAWILGAGVGAAIATRWARTSSVAPGVIVGVFILAGAATSLWAFPHPVWMVGAACFLPIVGFVSARVLALPRT